MAPLLTPELKACIGRKAHYPAREDIGRAAIRYFALAIGDENPLYRDDAAAQSAGHPTVIAPPTFIVETAQYAHGTPRENGYFAHEWDLPAEGFRTIRAGNDYAFERPVLPDDRIAVIYELEDIVEKTSASTGRTQLFVISTARFYDAQDTLVATNRETLVLQKLEPRA